MDKSEREKDRKRGRPAGKNRTPLSSEERRARNAQYERERRNESAQALSQLAEAAGCDPNLSNSDLLATVINYIRNATEMDPADDVTELQNVNERLLAQITDLKKRLAKSKSSKPSDRNENKSFKECTTVRTTSNRIPLKKREKKLAIQPMQTVALETPIDQGQQNENNTGTSMATLLEHDQAYPLPNMFLTDQDMDFLSNFGWLETQLASGRGS